MNFKIINKKIGNSIWILCLLNLNLMAQNSKDNAPETFKFDALQSSDMVDVSTGNFHYNVPVLTIPGPEGGYKVSLNYNAGIRMQDDASWVGLGWSVSPGSIIRNVNGVPDDYQSYETNQEVQAYRHYVSPVTSHNIFNQTWLNLSWYEVNSRYDKWDLSRTNFFVAFGSNAGENMARYYAHNAMNTGTQNLNKMTGKQYSQGIGIGINGGSTGYFVGGELNDVRTFLGSVNKVYDQNTVFYDVFHTEQNFESFGNSKKYTSGAFYLGDARHTDTEHGGETWGRQSYKYMMDMYTNKTGTQSQNKLSNNLSFPAYDNYSVSADGLSGSIMPVTLADGALLGEGYERGDESFQYMVENGNSNELFSDGGQNNSNSDANDKLSFMFRGQHPTTLKKPGTFSINYGAGSIAPNPGSLETATSLCSGGNITGGKNVKTHFDSNRNIVGFSVTDENGTTYNFTYPVYQYERVARTFDSQSPDYMEQRMLNKYAYAWMLTSIVGGDYIDKGTADVVDDADEGYWVKFDYGVWSNGYMWKTPYGTNEKTKSEENAKISSYEWGIKQLAYLNTIETKTHKAYFVKFVREDGMGSDFTESTSVNLTLGGSVALNDAFNGCTEESGTYLNDINLCSGACDPLPPSPPSGWIIDPNSIHQDNKGCNVATYYHYNSIALQAGSKVEVGAGTVNTIALTNNGKQKVLGLKKIILVKKNALLPAFSPTDFNYSVNGINSTDKVQYTINTNLNNPKYGEKELVEYCDAYSFGFPAVNLIQYNNCNIIRNKYYGGNVFDIYDLANSTIESEALQVVDFNYDYNLCKNSPNSTLIAGNTVHKNGKLTLNSVDIKGSDGNKMAPSYKFNYGLNSPFSQSNYGTLSSPEWLNNQDDWGYPLAWNANFKNIGNKDNLNKNLASSWSLTEVQTPLGGRIKVQYESDSYIKEAATKSSFNNQLKSFETNNSSTLSRNIVVVTFPTNFGNSGPGGMVVNNIYTLNLHGVKSFSNPSAPGVSRTLVGTLIQKISLITNSTVTFRFEITSGWNSDDNFNQLNSSYIAEATGAATPFNGATKYKEYKSIKIKFQDQINVQQAYIIGHSYSVSISGSNIPALIGTLQTGTTNTYIISNAIVTSINPVTKEVLFKVPNYIKSLSTLNPLDYSYVTGETKELFGGGVRVKKILMEDENGQQYKTQYEYKNGVTSFAPGSVFRKNIKYIDELPGPEVIYGNVTEKNVGANDIVNGITEYEFETMSSNIEGSELAYGDQLYIENGQIQNPQTIYGQENKTFHTRVGTIHNNTGRIGRLNKITSKNTLGQVLSSQKYEYYNKADLKSGVAQESFLERKRKTITSFPSGTAQYNSQWYLTYSSRIMYPSVLKKVEETKNSISTYVQYGNTTDSNNGFDIYTHFPLITDTKDLTGGLLREVTVPAYTKYSALFSKACVTTNKNILSPNAAQYSYFVNDGGPEKLVGATAQTWNNTWNYREYNSSSSIYENSSQTDVWRKHKTYVWKTDVYNDGTTGSFTGFSWSSTPNTGWQKTNEITSCDHFSQAIESKDINGNYSGIKKGGLNGDFVIASSGTSNYVGFVHSSFEDLLSNNYFGGEVSLGGGEHLSSPMIPAHTGNYLVKIPSAEIGPGYCVKENLQTGKTYRASVWVHQTSSSSTTLVANLDGKDGATPINIYESMDITDPRAIHVGNWILLTVNIVVPQGYVHVGGTGTNDLRIYVSNSSPTGGDAYIDDMRFQPVNSPVTGYVYDEKKGVVTAMLDNENFATFFTYDAANRLIKTEKETALGIKKVSESWYHYGRP